MNKTLTLFLVWLAINLGACRVEDCDQLPKTYSSYEEALKIIKTKHFRIQETINTSKSSWVRSASYYSCDGDIGIFILKTDSKEYLYSGIPVDIWNGFKSADSFGSYYNHNIKHKFSFKLNQ